MGRKTVVLLVGSCYPHDEVDVFDSEAPSQRNSFSRNSPCVLTLPNRLYPLHFGRFRGKVPTFLSCSAAVMVQMLHTVFLSLGSLSKYVRYGKCDFELFGWLFLSHLLTRLSSLVHQTVTV